MKNLNRRQDWNREGLILILKVVNKNLNNFLYPKIKKLKMIGWDA
jgi:hypothetical protein